MLWSPTDGITLRGSYTTGYLPPQLSQLVRTPTDTLLVMVRMRHAAASRSATSSSGSDT